MLWSNIVDVKYSKGYGGDAMTSFEAEGRAWLPSRVTTGESFSGSMELGDTCSEVDMIGKKGTSNVCCDQQSHTVINGKTDENHGWCESKGGGDEAEFLQRWSPGKKRLHSSHGHCQPGFQKWAHKIKSSVEEDAVCGSATQQTKQPRGEFVDHLLPQKGHSLVLLNEDGSVADESGETADSADTSLGPWDVLVNAEFSSKGSMSIAATPKQKDAFSLWGGSESTMVIRAFVPDEDQEEHSLAMPFSVLSAHLHHVVIVPSLYLHI